MRIDEDEFDFILFSVGFIASLAFIIWIIQ